MRLSFALTLLAAAQVSAFAPVTAPASSRWALQSTVETEETIVGEVAAVQQAPAVEAPLVDTPKQRNNNVIVPLTEAEINARLSMQMEKLHAKDRTSTRLSKEVS